jgi:serine/threonine protein kinase
MNNSKVVGEGSFGCVHKPPLLCEGKKTSDPSTVTKLMVKTEADKELREYDTMMKIDPKNKYYLGKPTSCNIEYSTSNITSASECKILKKADPRLLEELDKKYKLLVMKDGGKSLDNYAREIAAKSKPDMKKIKEFWLEVHRLFLGVKVFSDNGVVHHDLKAQNIVYNEDSGRVNFIDFGLMTTKRSIMDRAKTSSFGYAKFHFSFPLEIKYLNKVNYDQYSEFSISTKRGAIRRILDELKYKESIDAGAKAIRTLVALTAKDTAGKVPNEIPVNKRFISTVVTGLEKTVVGEIVRGKEHITCL